MTTNDKQRLKNPWLIAVWPGMGHVAIQSGFYLMSKLGMHGYAEYAPDELFDVNYIDVRDGLIKPFRRPRSRFFVWHDPDGIRDLIIFIGEAQPPLGRYSFCRKLVEFAKTENVQRVYTFAALATAMHPERESRVFTAASNREALEELDNMQAIRLDDGQISGLNGVLLGAAAEVGMSGICLLGEMPHFFSHLPYPKASLSVLKVFLEISKIDVDLSELEQQAHTMDRQLGQVFEQIQNTIEQQQKQQKQRQADEDEESYNLELFQNGKLTAEEKAHLERLFEEANKNRAKAYELKNELDRLDVFDEFEDRFLDLFKKPDQ